MTAEYEPTPQGQGNIPEQTMVIHDPRLEQKFTQVPHEVTFMRGLSRDAKQTYTILLSYAWKHQKCFPGMTTLCEDLEASEPTARKFLRELQDCRLIRVQRRGLQRTNLYHFLPVAEAKVPGRAEVETWRRSTLQHINKRAARFGAQGTLLLPDWEELCDRHGNRCLQCGATEKLVPDHIVPFAKGGANTIDNIQPLCWSCNNHKGTKVVDHRPRPERKLVSFPERTGLLGQERTEVCSHDTTPGLPPIEEEEYSEVRILRGTKGRPATHVAGADAPTAQKQPRPSGKATPAVDKDGGSRETPQYRVFMAYCTAMGAAVADMEGRKVRACTDGARFLAELNKRYADDPSAGTDAEADLCAMLRWKAGDLKTKHRDVLTLTVRAAYEDQAGWRKAGCPYRPELPEDEGESFYGHKKGTAAYRMFHDDPLMKAGYEALWAKHNAEMATMNGAH